MRKPVPQWEVEGMVIAAHTKGEVRAVLKRVIGDARGIRRVRLPHRTGDKIVRLDAKGGET